MSEWSTEERGSKRTDPEYDDAPASGAAPGVGDKVTALVTVSALASGGFGVVHFVEADLTIVGDTFSYLPGSDTLIGVQEGALVIWTVVAHFAADADGDYRFMNVYDNFSAFDDNIRVRPCVTGTTELPMTFCHLAQANDGLSATVRHDAGNALDVVVSVFGRRIG